MTTEDVCLVNKLTTLLEHHSIFVEQGFLSITSLCAVLLVFLMIRFTGGKAIGKARQKLVLFS